MRTVVTTREFDERGNCIRETVCEYSDPTPVPSPPQYPWPNQWWQSPVTCASGTFTTTALDDVQTYN